MALYEERNLSIYNALIENNVSSILELGCGTGRLLEKLAKSEKFSKLMGIDNSAKRILKARNVTKGYSVQFLQQSFLEIKDLYEMVAYDAIVASEVIEHLCSEDLEKFISLIFRIICPNIVIFTTPNKTYNCNYANLHNGLRHSSHVFEYDETDIIKFIDKIKVSYPMYSTQKMYCDSNHATHLIIFKKEEKPYEKN